MNIKAKIEKKLCSFIMNKTIRKMTKKIGSCEVLDDKVICHIEQDKVSKLEKGDSSIIQFDLNKIEFKDNLIKTTTCCKPVYYVFENINFSKPLVIKQNSIHKVHILFKGCKFTNKIKVSGATDITFENNKYIDPYSNIYSDHVFMCFENTRNVTIKDEDFHLAKEKKNKPFVFEIDAKNVKLVNTKLKFNEDNKFEIKANAIILENCDIKAPTIYFNSEAELVNTKIETKEKCIKVIDRKVLNEEEHNLNENGLELNSEELVSSRRKLIDTLNQIKILCTSAVEEKTDLYHDKLTNSSIKHFRL